MMRMAQAAHRSLAWDVTLVTSKGGQLPVGAAFAFPVRQRDIPARSGPGPGHVRLVNRNDATSVFELHASLVWLGRSGTTHECDVSLLPHVVAENLRNGGGGSPRGLPIAAFECKDRGGIGDTDEMRETLARMFDLALVTMPYPNWGCRLFESVKHERWGKHRTRYLDFFANGMFCIIRAGRFSKGANSLGSHYGIHRYGGIYRNSGSMRTAERTFMTLLDRIDTI